MRSVGALMAELHRSGVQLQAVDDRLRYSAPKGALSPALLAELKDRKTDVLVFLQKAKGLSASIHNAIPTAPSRVDLPLSFAQQRLWFLNQLEDTATAYHMPFNMKLQGRLHVVALERSLDRIRQRHESLRTRFPEKNGHPVQEILEPVYSPLPFIDLGRLDHPEKRIPTLLNEHITRPFDLAEGPLVRMFLLRVNPLEHFFFICMHHIVADGWSVGVMIRELGLAYEGFAQNRPPQLPPLPIQYGDYAQWQRNRLAEGGLQEQIDYWKKQLAGVPTLHQIPTDHPRPAKSAYGGKKLSLQLDGAATRALKELTKKQDATLFMTLEALFALLIFRWSGQNQVLIGSAVANRHYRELEPLIGFFVNTLVLRNDFSGNPSFLELLGRVRARALEAYERQDLPFEQLVEIVEPERHLNHNPLFQIMFNLHNVGGGQLRVLGLTIGGLDSPQGQAKFDLSMELTEQPEGLFGFVEYATDLFRRTTVETLIAHFKNLTKNVLNQPTVPVGDVEILGDEERDRILLQWNQTTAEPPRKGFFPELFEAQVQRSPEATALIHELENGPAPHWSYAHLERTAAGLAHGLQRHGIRPEAGVVLLGHRDPAFVAALMAVFKAGGVYIPIHPDQPRARIFQLIDQCRPKLILVSRVCRDRLDGIGAACSPAPPIVELEILATPSETPAPRAVVSDPDALAYLLFTSGSTGTPKGAMIRHGGMINHLRAKIRDLDLSAEDKIAQNASQSFDISLWQFLAAPLLGGTVHLIPASLAREPRLLLERVRRACITILEVVPSVMALMVNEAETPERLPPERLPHLRWLVPTGEALPPQLCRRWFALHREIPLLNAYGPTECSDDVTHHTICREDDLERIPIGTPVIHTQIYLVNTRLRPVPIKVYGQILVGGEGLGRGYLNLPDRTAEVFVPNPFASSPGARLYKTGDLGRYRETGLIEFHGRLDHQIKLRGFRIELGEIEAVIHQFPGIEENLVIAVESPSGKQLAAYLRFDPNGTPSTVPNEGNGPRDAALSAFLSKRLPDYMVPTALVWLENFPLTANGKIDRKRLPTPMWTHHHDAEDDSDESFNHPGERLLASLWQEVLGVARVGPRDHFFQLGGHSLLATQLVSRIRRQFRVELPLRELFTTPTLAPLARTVDRLVKRRDGVAKPPIERVSRREPLPLSFAQQRLWLVHQTIADTSAYHLPFAAKIRGQLDPSALETALLGLQERHEILRAKIFVRNDLPVQVMGDTVMGLALADLGGLGESDRDRELARLARVQAGGPFDLARGPLLRTLVVRFDRGEFALLLCMHHIVSDAWSIGILVREITVLYRSAMTGSPHHLPPLPIQYADYATWQRRWLQGPVFATEMAYWRAKLADVPPRQRLPDAKPHVGPVSNRAGRLSFTFSEDLALNLQRRCRQWTVTPFMVLLAGLKGLFHCRTGATDLVLGTDVANRGNLEAEPLIGFFINQLVLRTDLSGNPDFETVVARVKETTLDAYSHQDMPFDKLVEELQPQRDLEQTPFFQSKFVLQNVPRQQNSLESHINFEPIASPLETTKLDLQINMWEAPDRLGGSLIFKCDRFRKTAMTRLLEHFRQILERALEQPDLSLEQLGQTLIRTDQNDEERLLQEMQAFGRQSFKRHPKGKALT